jgi:hypothetical protein
MYVDRIDTNVQKRSSITLCKVPVDILLGYSSNTVMPVQPVPLKRRGRQMIDEELVWECYHQALCPASKMSRLLAEGLAARHSQGWAGGALSRYSVYLLY